MILPLVKPFGSMLKVKDVNIYYNIVFTMHTKLTVFFLLIFSILVSAHEYFGKPINCIMGDTGDNAIRLFAESNCWVNGTFTLRNVTKFVDGRETWEKVPEYQKYYQWITIILLMQAVLFRIPAFIWKSWERGRIKQLCSSLGSPVLPTGLDYQYKKNQVVGYLKIDNSRVHAVYVLRFVACEIMNFLIVVINMCLLNAIFNQFWIRYLPVVLALFKTQGESFSSLASDLFPKLAKCAYSDYGPSGSKQIHDALCLLSLNILNEKIFAFLYIWLILLLLVSGCNLITRFIVLISSNLRLKMIRSLALDSSVPLTKHQLEIILHGNNIGDWFILFLLASNLNPFVFREILDEVANSKGMKRNFIDKHLIELFPQ